MKLDAGIALLFVLVQNAVATAQASDVAESLVKSHLTRRSESKPKLEKREFSNFASLCE